MSLERLLTSSARRITVSVESPPAPSAARLGEMAIRRRRQRRTVVAAAAGVATIAVLAAAPTLTGSPDGGPTTPLHPPELGDVAAWLDADGDVHVGADVLDLPDPSVDRGGAIGYPAESFALTSRGIVWPSRSFNGPLYWQPLDGEPVALTETAPRHFAADSTGDRVVWITRSRDIVTYDVTERRTIDTTPVRGTLPSSSPILDVDDDRVVYETDEAVRVVDPVAGSTSRLPGVTADDLLDVADGTMAVATSRLADRQLDPPVRSLTSIEFRSEGGVVEAVPGRLFREGRLSPDGTWFVTSTGYESGLRTVVLDTTTGEEVPLDLPDRMRGPYGNPWGWTGGGVVMIALIGPTGAADDLELWSCRPATGRCQQVLDDSAMNAHPD